MATTPFRLPAKISALLQKFSGMAQMTMTDWILERVEEEDETLRTKVQPIDDRPSLIREVYAWSRANLEGKRAQKGRILAGLAAGQFDLAERGIDGLTPLHWAARGQGDVELVAAIVKAGHVVNPADDYGNTPLVLAVAEQDRHLETNLPVIQFLLSQSTDRDLLQSPSLLGYDQTLFEYARFYKMHGTVGLLRNRFGAVDLEAVLRELPATEIPEWVCRILFYQGKTWDQIAQEMRARGIEPGLIWFNFNRMGAWGDHLKKLRTSGLSDAECVVALRGIHATWPDISGAYRKQGYRPAEVIPILLHQFRAENGGPAALAALVAGALPVDGDEDLIPVRALLEELGTDVFELVGRMPFVEERKRDILRRMGAVPKSK